MSTISKPGQAGTLESSDIIITVAPAPPGADIVIELVSPVAKQYGKQIKQAIKEELTELGVADAAVQANDKGALDCTVKARVKTAVERSRA
ncbi:citrate lyase acyl carrier protein|uniref:Citrate lyase subunit gamma (Acyl carrier protein) n=1 Tax=Dendrosporobacter quercicolus TaxID=146817 RepID=A0A1G9SVN3_9FIRM|nr:citrate lyase acyl carrier protein [Dendrosporobacter quercicolus]NSL48601.1 citrate lyase acyl carrier protein [Dendrosporobacter quercicolus DSM 1736]SDM39506.1 citrate lyase subunit gamma (acyl carrier protein) [Dendrosporobacter quercicolus]